MGLDGDLSTSSGELQIIPNPATGEATILCDLPAGYTRSTVLLYTMNGELIKRIDMGMERRITLNLGEFASGTYLYQLETDQGVIGTKRLVVVR